MVIFLGGLPLVLRGCKQTNVLRSYPAIVHGFIMAARMLSSSAKSSWRVAGWAPSGMKLMPGDLIVLDKHTIGSLL